MDREQRIDDLVPKILSGDESLIHELWQELDDLCGWYCRKLLRQLPEEFKLEFDDLYNCGYIALCDALQHYSAEKKAKFSRYYLFYLTGAIYRENHLSAGGHYEDGRRRFDPVITGGTISLDAPTDESQDTPEPLYNFLSNEQIESPSVDTVERAAERIYIEQLRTVMEDLILDLPEDQQYLIRQKYYIGAEGAQIAKHTANGQLTYLCLCIGEGSFYGGRSCASRSTYPKNNCSDCNRGNVVRSKHARNKVHLPTGNKNRSAVSRSGNFDRLSIFQKLIRKALFNSFTASQG